jgi:hypothetical protein
MRKNSLGFKTIWRKERRGRGDKKRERTQKLVGEFRRGEEEERAFLISNFRRVRSVVCSETSAYEIQTPGNCPEESIQQEERD